MISTKSVSKRQSGYRFLLLLVFSVANLVMAISAMGNGAISRPGYFGTDLTVEPSKPFDSFIVDEEVVVDLASNRTKVTYTIINTARHAESFNMLFPIESRNCDSYYTTDKSWEKVIDFKVKLNGSTLLTKRVDTAAATLKGEYEKLGTDVCALVSFDVVIKPGKNTIALDYNILLFWGEGDGVGATWSMNYSIWPAKNWVTKFRKALWRVVLPNWNTLLKGGDYKYQFDDWYSQVEEYPESGYGREINFMSWRKREVDIRGPGVRKDFASYVDFTATDYMPAGQISIRFTMYELHFLVEQACMVNQEMISSEACIDAFFRIHPYVGNQRCYDVNDLLIIPEYMGFSFDPSTMLFLRNEIFARKGYIFKSPELNKFFSKMAWYTPKTDNVTFGKIEKWNIEFIRKVEKKVDQDIDEPGQTKRKARRGHDEDGLRVIRRTMPKCPQ